METQAALVRANGTAHLDTITAVDLDLALIVDPRHAEQDRALRLDHTLKNTGLQVVRIGLQEGPEAAQYLFHRLMEFRLGWVTFFQACEEVFDGFDHGKVSADD